MNLSRSCLPNGSAVDPQAHSFRAGGVQLSCWVLHFQITPLSRADPFGVYVIFAVKGVSEHEMSKTGPLTLLG